jgi:hypothetical protein
MRRSARQLWGNRRGAAAAEMALVTPLLLIVMFGAAEVGNFFMSEHAVVKTVRDGARFAARLKLKEEDFACTNGSTAGIWESPNAETEIRNVVIYGTVDDSGTGRFPASSWAAENQCDDEDATITVDIRCVDPAEAELNGIYATLPGEIPVVKVNAAMAYRPLLSALGVNLAGSCLRAESEAPVTGL